MEHVLEAMENYLNAVEVAHGKDYRERTHVRHAGGSDVVLEYPEGHKAILGIGQLDLMTEHLHRQAASQFGQNVRKAA